MGPRYLQVPYLRIQPTLDHAVKGKEGVRQTVKLYAATVESSIVALMYCLHLCPKESLLSRWDVGSSALGLSVPDLVVDTQDFNLSDPLQDLSATASRLWHPT